jgi:predicted transcriptional regulator
LEATLKDTVLSYPQFAKMKDMALMALNYLFTQLVTNITQMSEKLDKSYNTISNILKQFVEIGLVFEDTNNKRNKLYRFESYLTLLEKEY